MVTPTMRSKARTTSAVPATKRVAIYTRKSTEEGLDSEFNSLDAQRQAAEAYVASQRGEGWAALPERYDDGGFTGANTDRPAFKRLLADVANGKIDIVAVYKYDRLSRNIFDFLQTMRVFEQQGVSFVAVTQPFNTTTPTGRLLLNMLASFSQFERDMTSERTRDKMRASRRKGMWTGGRPVLGYDAKEKRLVVNKAEADTVREIFKVYLEQGSLLAAVEELDRRAIKTKRLVSADGRAHASRPFDKGALSRLLTNALYIGKVAFEGQLHDGNHEAIVNEKTWSAVQHQLKAHGRGASRNGSRNKWGALLKGLVSCGACGHALGHVFTQRGGRVYRYYQCQTSQKRGAAACPGSRAPAGELEQVVVSRIRVIGRDEAVLKVTVDAAKRAATEKRPELEANLRRLEQEQRRLAAEVGNLLDAIASGGSASNVLSSRLGEVDETHRKAKESARAARTELVALETNIIDEADLRAALAEFTPVWDELFPREKARLLHLLVEQVTYTAAEQKVAITFRPSGIRSLAASTGGKIS